MNPPDGISEVLFFTFKEEFARWALGVISYTRVRGGSFWARKHQESNINLFPEIPYCPILPAQVCRFFADYAKFRSSGLLVLLRKKIAHFDIVSTIFYWARCFFAPIPQKWALKTPKSSYYVWTRFPIMAHNIAVKRRRG